MNIQDWGIGRIMQLPDCCFGRRFVISFSGYNLQNSAVGVISEISLPDRCVLWTMATWTRYQMGIIGNSIITFNFVLTDQIPAAVAAWQLAEPLLSGQDEVHLGQRVVRGNITLDNLRMVIPAQGRRVALRVYENADIKCEWAARLVFSSIPTEVPDWLLSV
jgi:hypothetical protein